MKKVSFTIRNFDKEKFLTFHINDEANLDEEVLDFLEDEEPKGIVPIIFEEGEETDSFSYDITNKIHLCELSSQEINAEMVLSVFRGIILALIDMRENRIPLSYLVLNRDYVYIDSDYRVEFICIPLEDMNEEVELNTFLRNVIASLRFNPIENGDYVAKILTYINNTTMFNLDNMITLLEELMRKMGIDIPDDNTANIYAEYQEISDQDIQEVDDSKEQEDPYYGVDGESFDSYYGLAEEQEVENKEEIENSAEEEDLHETISIVEENESNNEEGKVEERAPIQKNEIPASGIVLEDELDDFLQTKPDKLEFSLNGKADEPKINKNIKINRASIVKNTQEELKAEEALKAEAEEKKETEVIGKEEEQETSNSILSKSIGITSILGSGNVPKANPYLIRVNTDEKVMINKQNFRIGKANMGVDYTVKGNGAVSRIHATILNKEDLYYIKDNKSTNHTYVNDKRVPDGENELLTHDSKIVLGDEEFIFKLR